MQGETVRFVRFIEMTGTREAVEKNLNNRGVKGTIVRGGVTFREGTLGDFPEDLTPILLEFKQTCCEFGTCVRMDTTPTDRDGRTQRLCPDHA